MAWSDPPAVNAGDDISASDHNTYVKDNLVYLHSGQPVGQIIREGVGDYTMNSASWADVDGTNLSLTLSVTSGRVKVEAFFRGGADNTAGSKAEFDIACDSVRIGGTNGLAAIQQNTSQQVHISAIFTGLSAGSHVFRIQYRNATGGATATVYNNAWPVALLAHEL